MSSHFSMLKHGAHPRHVHAHAADIKINSSCRADARLHLKVQPLTLATECVELVLQRIDGGKLLIQNTPQLADVCIKGGVWLVHLHMLRRARDPPSHM